MIITGVIDGPLSEPLGTPRAVELYVVKDIPDLNIFQLQVALNGGQPSSSINFLPSRSATAGDFIYVSFETADFNTFFGFDANYTNNFLIIDGDDAIILLQGGVSLDIFGVVGVSGNGQPWEYMSSWGYRKIYSSAAFNLSDWEFPGPGALDGASTNTDASAPFPVGSFCCK
ncbi:unnamed protein product [Symbiodinium sp. CCMP2456]|nr:unnamed protein product [Symbiodinium sp. CCMP2456]